MSHLDQFEGLGQQRKSGFFKSQCYLVWWSVDYMEIKKLKVD
jgi:hypothetical protein